MSLEATIQENTNAIRELIAAIKTGVPTTAAQVAAVVSEAKTTPCAGHDAETAKEEGKAKPEKEATAKKTTAAATEAAASTQSTAEAGAGAGAAQEKKADNSEASDKAAEVPAYTSVVSAINKLAQGKGRDAAVAILSKFGVTRGPELKPEQYAAVITECETAGA